VLKEKFRRDRKARILLERLDNENAQAPFELSPEELLISSPNARRRAVVDALNSISEHQRRLVMLILFSGYTMTEAAEEMGIKGPAARQLASRAVKALRQVLIQRGEIDG
jgi:RNA polymerase sigma factor (sigma-70 family)